MSGDEPNPKQLPQPKPNLPQSISKSSARNSWSGGKTLKSDKKGSKTKLQIDLETLRASRHSARNRASVGEPIRPREEIRKLAAACDKKRNQISSAPNRPFSTTVRALNTMASPKSTIRPQPPAENVQLFYDHIDFQQTESFMSLPKTVNVSTLRADEVDKSPKKTVNFLLTKPSKKIAKSKVDKIEIYEPKLALYFSKDCKADL